MSSLRAPIPLKLSGSVSAATTGDPYKLPSQNPTLSAFGRSISADAVPSAQLQVKDGRLGTSRPTPSPPFRLIAPSVANSSRAPSPFEPRKRSEDSISEFPQRGEDIANWAQTAQRPTMARATTEYDRLRKELRNRPLHDSMYGRQIVALLTYRWIIAPSGIAAMAFDDSVGEEHIDDCARSINDLNCGASAFHSVSAGVLAVHNLQHLNRLLVRCGLSPIQPTRAGESWPPLTARQPPDFLLEGWSPGPNRQEESPGSER